MAKSMNGQLPMFDLTICEDSSSVSHQEECRLLAHQRVQIEQCANELRDLIEPAALHAQEPAPQPTTKSTTALRFDAVVTAFEALMAAGYFLHAADGKALGRDEFIRAFPLALIAAEQSNSQPTEFPAQEQFNPAFCLDCGRRYEDFGLDTVLFDDQWIKIHPSDGGLLCANCIAQRVSRLPDAIILAARIIFKDDHEAWRQQMRSWRLRDGAAEAPAPSVDIEQIAQFVEAMPRSMQSDEIAHRIRKQFGAVPRVPEGPTK